MAQTWISTAAAVGHLPGGSILGVFNASGSARIVRAYLLYMANIGPDPSSISMNIIGGIRQIAAMQGGTAVTPIACDTNSTALASQITSASAATVNITNVLRTFMYNTEKSLAASDGGFLQTMVFIPNIEYGRYGMDAAAPEPLVCRAGEGVDIGQMTSAAVGAADGEIIFTNAAS